MKTFDWKAEICMRWCTVCKVDGAAYLFDNRTRVCLPLPQRTCARSRRRSPLSSLSCDQVLQLDRYRIVLWRHGSPPFTHSSSISSHLGLVLAHGHSNWALSTIARTTPRLRPCLELRCNMGIINKLGERRVMRGKGEVG